MFKVFTTILLTFSFANSFASDDKVIYGDDDRTHVYASANEMFKTLSKSTAAMVPNSSIEYKFNNLLVQISGKALKDSMQVCKEERYADVVTSAMCSGFLVGDDLLVTAGHCIPSESACKGNKWVFDFRHEISVDSKTSFVDPSSVYSCVKVIHQELDSTTKNDFALIQLDRKVTNRMPLKFRKEGKIADGTEIVVIGHPSGLPTIIADGAKVRTNENAWFFDANLDTFGGNSGSAVFDANTGLIEGILVRGARDYVYDYTKKCYKVNECANDACRGEDVTRITVIPELAPGMTPVPPVVTDTTGNDTEH